MNFTTFFNYEYAWEKFTFWITHFKVTSVSNIIQILIAIILAVIVWKMIKNIVIALILALLCFIVYQSYFNVGQAKVINNKDTQVEIKTTKPDKLKDDVTQLFKDIFAK